ncbi:Nibrin [Symbiodinium microadriaticum]|uniref:Nibrin n=1 Tax=Symbiodinium microadriaticum TaxID=2951 RepID=A0A1Q9CZE3_SYMMI|nr:Nibrin [Symbiodinium microadriaticum]
MCALLSRAAAASELIEKLRSGGPAGDRRLLATAAERIAAEPAKELDLFDIFFHLHRVSKDRETRLMALLSGVAVFKDLVPGYRIREPTEQERAQIRSKPVLALERYELKLLQTYRRLLPDLEAMSWQLALEGASQSQPTSDSPLLLLPGSAQVGRGQTAIIRSTHQSVSRVHAELVIKATEGSLADVRPLEISLIDRSSTGHTFVNELKTPGNGVPVKLQDGDFFTCGIDPLRYTVRWRPILLSVSSRLSAAELRGLEDLARACGVFLTTEWTQQCTHLLIEQWAITPKLLCCIIDGALPVASSFLDDLVSRRDTELRPEPATASCAPRPPGGADAAYSTELSAYASSPSPRRQLLKGSWIIFSHKQAYDALHLPLEHAGASFLLVAQDVPAGSMVQDLKRGVAMHGAPSEVWIIPALPPGLAPLLSELGELRCPCLVVGQQAVVAALLSGQKKRATDTATIVPKTELPESFPDTHQNESTQAQAPLRQRSRISRKRPMPSDGDALPKPVPEAKEERVPQPVHRSEVGAVALPGVELKVKEELGEENATAEQPLPSQSGPKGAERAHAPGSSGPGHKPEPERPAEVIHSQQATLSMRAAAPPMSQRPKLEEKQEEKISPGTIQSVQSTHLPPEVKTEEELIIDGAEPVVHPTGIWLNPLKARCSNRLVLEGVELPRASWATADKRAPEVYPSEGKPNFKRFRKGQSTEVTTFVHVVPWAPPARRLDFETQPSIDMRESEIPNLGM